jgi:hypothetical protein
MTIDTTDTHDLETDLRFLAQRDLLDWRAPMDDVLRRHGIDVSWDAWARMTWWGPLEIAFASFPSWSDIVIDPPEYAIQVKDAGSALFVHVGVSLHPTWVTWLQTVLLLRSRLVSVDAPDDWRRMGSPMHAMHASVGRRIRYALTRPPYTPEGPSITLRALPQTWRTIDDLITLRVITREAADMLTLASRSGATLLISGLTGSGKTTLAGAILQRVGENRRVIIIEDAMELPRPVSSGNSVEALTANMSFADCVRFCLRQAPDMIVVGEVRGPEGLAMLEAAATGHPGLATIHAADARSALLNLERMAMSDPKTRPEYVRALLNGGTVPLVAAHIGFVGRRRTVTEIIETIPTQSRPGDPLPFNLLFEFNGTSAMLEPRYPPQGAWFRS